MNATTAIRRIEELLEEIDEIRRDSDRLIAWRQKSQSVLVQQFGEQSLQVKAWNRISFYPMAFVSGTPVTRERTEQALSNGLKEARGTLEAAIFALKNESEEQEMTGKADSKKVFVVYGRNEKARSSMFAFLRAIGLHPLEWNHLVEATGKGSPYVGEVLEKGFEIAQAAVVLMTPDDEARLRSEYHGKNEPKHEIELTPQARQNVLLEAGMSLGLQPNRTIIVELGHLRPISDILGRHVIRMNNSPEKRNDLAHRLKTAGCDATTSGSDWLKDGNFDDCV